MSDMTQYNSVSARISKKERVTHPALRLVISTAVILGLWQLVVVVFDMPSFILPSPIEVLDRLVTRYDVLLKHTWVTAQEILLGLALGLSMGLLFALQMLMFEPLKRWLLPILIASQAILCSPSRQCSCFGWVTALLQKLLWRQSSSFPRHDMLLRRLAQYTNRLPRPCQDHGRV